MQHNLPQLPSPNYSLYTDMCLLQLSFYSATKDQKTSYKSQQNTILYTVHTFILAYTHHTYNIHIRIYTRYYNIGAENIISSLSKI